MAKPQGSKEGVAIWLDQWNSGCMEEFQINRPHPKLMEHYDKFIVGKARAKIFVPLCGDTYDMKHLAEKGHEIVGLECAEAGIRSFFKKHNIPFVQEECKQIKGSVFKSKDGNYRLYCCDLFDFDESVEGKFDAIVDCASMGALPRKLSQAYADLMKKLMKLDCRHILECFVYDLNKWPNSEPVCFTLEELQKYYGDTCTVEKIDEGPNPWAEEEAECDAMQGETESSGGLSKDNPEITGAAYFLIKPKQK